jgi:hypothetical protein
VLVAGEVGGVAGGAPPGDHRAVFAQAGQGVALQGCQHGEDPVQFDRLAGVGGELVVHGGQVHQEVVADLYGWPGADGVQVVGAGDLPVLKAALPAGQDQIGQQLACGLGGGAAEGSGAQARGGPSQQPATLHDVVLLVVFGLWPR